MSGSPKYSQAELVSEAPPEAGRQRQERLEAERRRQAEREAQLRREAEERERQRQLEAYRRHIRARLQNPIASMQNRGDAIDPADSRRSRPLDRSLPPRSRSVTHIERFTSIDLEFDPNGLSKAVEALERVKEAIFQGDPVPVRQPLPDVKTPIARPIESVSERQPEWQQQKARSEGDLGAIARSGESLE